MQLVCATISSLACISVECGLEWQIEKWCSWQSEGKNVIHRYYGEERYWNLPRVPDTSRSMAPSSILLSFTVVDQSKDANVIHPIYFRNLLTLGKVCQPDRCFRLSMTAVAGTTMPSAFTVAETSIKQRQTGFVCSNLKKTVWWKRKTGQLEKQSRLNNGA